jgi:hypothetical protein
MRIHACHYFVLVFGFCVDSRHAGDVRIQGDPLGPATVLVWVERILLILLKGNGDVWELARVSVPQRCDGLFDSRVPTEVMGKTVSSVSSIGEGLEGLRASRVALAIGVVSENPSTHCFLPLWLVAGISIAVYTVQNEAVVVDLDIDPLEARPLNLGQSGMNPGQFGMMHLAVRSDDEVRTALPIHPCSGFFI